MLKITFYGGTQEVTGANHLLEYESKEDKLKLLIDCGLFQGSNTCEDKNREEFPYKPQSIDVLIVTHAHLDHIGRIPKLVKDGFKGRIISTEPTRDFAELMLTDSLGILTKEAKREEKDLIYDREDVEKAMGLWETVEYNEEFELSGLKITLRDAGHILGSAMVEINKDDPSDTSKHTRIVFSGDLGNPPVSLLEEPYKMDGADYLIIESTYGDREHEEKKKERIKIERAIEDIVKKKGVLMIPAFSIERTQELLFELNDLIEHGRVPKVPIFLDSPLAIGATGVYRKHQRFYNKNAKSIINSGDDIFQFPGLKLTEKTEESKAINDVPPPKIVIAGSGMSVGGRIIHHEKRYLSDPNSVLMLVSFQSPGSLGRQLEDGAKHVKIMGDEIPVRAKIVEVKGYSAHPDVNGLYEFAERSADTLKKVFVVQGELKSALFFAQRVKDYLGVEACVPESGESFVIEK